MRILIKIILLLISSNFLYSQTSFIKFFEIRYSLYVPDNRSEFTIGLPYKDKLNYKYIRTRTTLDIEVPLEQAKYNIVFLTQDELNEIYKNKTKVNLVKLQLLDIQKFYKLYYPYSEFKYGVKLNNENNIILENNKPIPNVSLEEYINGKTIVTPVIYNQYSPYRLFFNLANPILREYLAKYCEYIATNFNTSKSIFLDNVLIVKYNLAILNYIKGDTLEEKIYNYAYYYSLFLKLLYEKNYKIIINTIKDNDEYNHKFAQYIIKNGYFEGILVENTFFYYEDNILKLSKDIEYYQNLSNILKNKDKKLLFIATSNNLKDEDVKKIWFWINLIGEENTYVYISTSYQTNLYKYNYENINFPLGKAYLSRDNIYIREFLTGTIKFFSNNIEYNPN